MSSCCTCCWLNYPPAHGLGWHPLWFFLRVCLKVWRKPKTSIPSRLLTWQQNAHLLRSRLWCIHTYFSWVLSEYHPRIYHIPRLPCDRGVCPEHSDCKKGNFKVAELFRSAHHFPTKTDERWGVLSSASSVLKRSASSSFSASSESHRARITRRHVFFGRPQLCHLGSENLGFEVSLLQLRVISCHDATLLSLFASPSLMFTFFGLRQLVFASHAQDCFYHFKCGYPISINSMAAHLLRSTNQISVFREFLASPPCCLPSLQEEPLYAKNRCPGAFAKNCWENFWTGHRAL